MKTVYTKDGVSVKLDSYTYKTGLRGPKRRIYQIVIVSPNGWSTYYPVACDGKLISGGYMDKNTSSIPRMFASATRLKINHDVIYDALNQCLIASRSSHNSHKRWEQWYKAHPEFVRDDRWD